MNAGLVPLREDGVSYISDVSNLPSFTDGMQKLIEEFMSENHVDMIGKFKDLKMDENSALVFDGKTYSYNRHTLSQAVARIKPAGVRELTSYMVACNPALRYINYDYWHNKKYVEQNVQRGNSIMLRTVNMNDKPILRAVVSNLYVAIDDPIALDRLSKFVPADSKLSVYRGDVYSRYGLFWQTEKVEVSPGDELLLSVKIMNSETGAGSINMIPMVYSVGLGGWFEVPRGSRSLVVRHVGEAAKKLRDAYTKIEAFTTPFIERLKASYNDSYDTYFKDSDTMFNAIGAAFDLNKNEISAIKSSYTTNPKLATGGTRYHVASAITRSGYNSDLDTADKYHNIAGMLIVRGWSFIQKFVKDVESDEEFSVESDNVGQFVVV